MRLPEHERHILRNAALDAFGEEAKMYLFGSRLDDEKRGGDIDLFIETQQRDVHAIFQAKIRFLAAVKLLLGEQKFDVLIDYPTREHRPKILHMARSEGVEL